MANIRFKLLDEEQKANKSNVRFQVIDNTPSNDNITVENKINLPPVKSRVDLTNNILTSNTSPLNSNNIFNNRQMSLPVFNKISDINNQQVVQTNNKNNGVGETNSDGYTYTGKNYGDYFYQNYAKDKDLKIYSKDGKYYLYDGFKYRDVDSISFMTSAKQDEEDKKKAVSLGYKDWKNDNKKLKVSDMLKLDTANLTNKEYSDYSKDLSRQREKEETAQAEKYRINYGGALGTLKQYADNASSKINKELVQPIKNIQDNYETGKLNNQLALEYYKQMNGEPNDVSRLKNKIDTYNSFNQDLLNDPGLVGTAIQNANTQIESLKNQGIAATVLGGTGAVIGAAFGGAPGALTGAKVGGSIGYTVGSTPYTYMLEAGNQYQALIDMGVPKDVAAKHAKTTGAINAAIESGENIIDLATLGISSLSGKAVSKEVVNELVDDYGEKKVREWLSKKVGAQVADKIVNIGTTGVKSYAQNIASEAIEEMTQEGTSIASERLATNESGIKRETTIKDDINRILKAGESAAVSTALTGPVFSMVGSVTTNIHNSIESKIQNKTISTNTINETISDEITKEYEKTGEYPTGEQISQIQQTIYSQLANENVDIVNSENNTPISKETDNSINYTYQEKTNENSVQDKKLEEIGTQLNTLQKQVKESNDNSSTFAQDNKTINKYKYEISDNEKINKLNESAVQNNFNNSEQTKKYMKILEKIIKDKNVSIIFDSNLKTLDGKFVNGKYENGTITINPNSNRAGEFIAIHELTHAIGTDSMKNIIETYRKSNSEFNKAVNELLSKNYNTNELVEEAIADVSAQLFGNQEFINNLSQNNPNLFKRIYNEIKYLWHQFRGYTNQNQFIEDLQYKWEQAYRSSKKLNDSLKFSIAGINGINNLNDSKFKRDALNAYDKAQQLANRNTDNEDIRTQTKWFQDKNNDWKFEVDDSKIKLNNNIIKMNSEYQLGDIMQHDLLFNLYPELKKYSIKFDNMNKNGSFNRESKTIRINNSLINSINDKQLKGTILHEVQHAIQQIENFEGGMSSKLSKKAYYEKLGEIEADDTKQRFLRGLDKKAREHIAPESSNQQPKHSRYDEYMKTRKIVDKVKDSIYPIFSRGDSNVKENQEINMEHQDENSRLVDGRRKLNKELDNSSFSYDNEGRKLSKQQQKYFKDSKVRDEKGNLEVVYHTMTNEGVQFNEFNPVGTEYYRFGDQIVNYYTNSKDMSGSYAGQDYIMADTKKITSMKEIKDYIKTMNILGWGSEHKYELLEENGKYRLIDNSNIPNTNKTWQQVYDEANKYKNTLTEKEYNQFKDMFNKSSQYESDGRYNIDSYLKDNKYDYGSEEDKIAQKYLNIDNKNVYERGIYFDVLFRNAKYHTVEAFNNKQDLFKNIKSVRGLIAKRQYQGYVNITNPYVVDAERRNWNQVISQSNDFIDELEERVPQEIKDNLTRLYQESENKSAEAREEFNVLENAIRGMWNSAVDEDIKKVNEVVKRVGYNEIEEILNDIPTGVMGVNGWYNLADTLKEQGIIGDSTSKLIIDEFKLPEQIKEYIQEQYTKEIPIHKLWTNDITKLMKQLDRNTTLKDIYNTNQQKYLEFDKYRMPNSYFLEKISSDSSEPGHVDLGYDLNDMFETRAEMYSPEHVGEEIAQAASVGFSKPEMIRLWGTSKTTNDVVKEVIASNKDGKTNYDGVIIKNVYDYGGKSATGRHANDLYVTFNSNQFKAIDNTTPTKDADIRYSKENKTWQKYLEDTFESKGTKTNLTDVKIPTKKKVNPPVAKTNTTETYGNPTKASSYGVPTKEDIVKSKVSKEINKNSTEALKKATSAGKTYLQLKYSEAKQLKEDLRKYVGKTKEQLTNAKTYNSIRDEVKNFMQKEIEYLDNDVKQVKNQIRNTNIKVDENLKEQITDYNDFRKSNFGKLKLSSTGQNIDSIYQELSDAYPYYFSSDINTEADMLYELSDFMNRENIIKEKYNLTDSELETATKKIFNALVDNSLSEKQIEEIQDELMKKYSKKTRKLVQEELLNDMGITLDDISSGKDISSLGFQRTDPVRLNEKVFGAKVGQKINNATINHTKHNEAERTRFLNKQRNEIKELGIKARSKESAAVQKYAEKQYINKYGELVKYGNKELASEFPNIETQNKIKHAAEVLRGKYDAYIEQINDVITELGYDPIPKRQDYMRHFNELNDKLSQWGIPLNPADLNKENIPTDINGLTDQFKPGKNWFASAMQRKGLNTTYDAITGIDGYLEGASNLIYHTEDIQRYRALSKMIRDTYGQTHGLDGIDVSTQEGQQRLNDIFDNKLSKYAAWLDEQANALAGKKGGIDRAAERLLGRKIYSVLDTAKKQVGSNMTGFNVRSALTNFASAVQGASKTNKSAFIKGTVSTLQNMIHNDGLIDKSDFLTSRFGSDQLSKKLWQKARNAGQIFMTGTDYFTANQIWRSKYYENLSKGMTETQAIKKADDFASRIMGDRSKGATAELFNSKTLGLLTQFQLEVNNQWSSMIHDNKMDIQNGEKTGATVVFQLGQLAAMSYMFNNLMKALTGSSVMFDPIDLLKRMFGSDDDEDKSIEDRATEVLGEILDNLPFASIFNGGRIPVGEAFKGAGTLLKKLTNQKGDYGNEIKWEDVKDDLISSAFYWLLPTGYGQAKKTYSGLSMYDPKYPIAGSYTKTGRLRFPVNKDVGSVTQAALFGQYANKNAREYLDNGYTPLTEKQQKIYKNLNIPISDYWKNKTEYNYSYENPEKYAAIKLIADYDSYTDYSKQINEIKKKYDNTNIRKEKVMEYIDSLDLNKNQKAIFKKLVYTSYTNNDNQIMKYVNNLDITENERGNIYKALGMKR